MRREENGKKKKMERKRKWIGRGGKYKKLDRKRKRKRNFSLT
jgi:hypothetical protein